MKIFIDTAIIKEIEWAEERGLIDGVTTNPTLLTMADRKLGEVVHDVLNIVKDRPVSIELVSQTTDELVEEAKTIVKLAKNVVVKVPMTDEGMMAVQQLEERGIRTNVTLVFSPAQALLAARAGATFVSIFVGRLDDIGKNGMQVVRDTVKLLKNYEFKSMVLAASIRSVQHVEEAALAGADIATIPLKVLIQMYRHELTDKGVKKFLLDWEKVPK
ncbi:fructose-6-phosphate aldolase [Patescibacteria group bacterium]|nr:fructose-6-phosphate aldolase [Patescibacteria group bacterium]MBU0964218.1 fructose-6-phosphate aldolase [Patescibacteria group bacterium]